jgi:hypothetical protein
VVVTNSQGSVTSRAAVLTVTPATTVGGTTSDKVNLLRLLALSNGLVTAGGFAGGYVSDDTDTFRGPRNFCAGGSVTGTFNGGAIPAAGTALPGTGTFAATATNCVFEEETYNGGSTLSYNLTSFSPPNGNASVTSSNMRVRSGTGDDREDYTANGSASYTARTTVANNLETIEFVITPSANATIRNELSGLTSTFASGSFATTVDERVDAAPGTVPLARFRLAYNQLNFSVGGQAYNANGFYELNLGATGGIVSGRGEVVLTAIGGARVGRIFATAEGVFVEADGQVQNFKARTKGKRF